MKLDENKLYMKILDLDNFVVRIFHSEPSWGSNNQYKFLSKI